MIFQEADVIAQPGAHATAARSPRPCLLPSRSPAQGLAGGVVTCASGAHLDPTRAPRPIPHQLSAHAPARHDREALAAIKVPSSRPGDRRPRLEAPSRRRSWPHVGALAEAGHRVILQSPNDLGVVARDGASESLVMYQGGRSRKIVADLFAHPTNTHIARALLGRSAPGAVARPSRRASGCRKIPAQNDVPALSNLRQACVFRAQRCGCAQDRCRASYSGLRGETARPLGRLLASRGKLFGQRWLEVTRGRRHGPSRAGGARPKQHFRSAAGSCGVSAGRCSRSTG